MLRRQLRNRPPLRLTRKRFYDLTEDCRDYAFHLARFDQHRVNLKECHQFNDWLDTLKRYDRLAPELRSLHPARPIARWQVLTLLAISWLILGLWLPSRVDRMMMSLILSSLMFTMIALLFMPESLYGTTIELIQGKVLRVVDVLLEILNSEQMGFSEAAFFQARENLLEAQAELRQQIDLAHRP